MKIIRPTDVTDAILTSTDIPETDYAAYNAGTTYTLGAHVISTATHRKYTSLQASNTGNPLPVPPETETDWWIDSGPTNLWAMFDTGVETQTSQAESFYVVLTPGRIDSVALLNINGSTYQVEMTSAAAGGTVYDTGEVSVEATEISDWYEYFYEPIITISDVVLTDLPPYTDGVVRVTISAPGSTAMLGMLVIGLNREIGTMLARARVSINDYSIKSTDTFGNTTIVQRPFSKRLAAEILIANALVDTIARLLTDYRAVAVVWVGDPEFTSTIVYGYFKSFEFVIENTAGSTYNIEIEGLT